MKTLQSRNEAKVGTRVRIGNGWSTTYNRMRGTIINNSQNIRRSYDNWGQVIIQLDKEYEGSREVFVPIVALVRI